MTIDSLGVWRKIRGKKVCLYLWPADKVPVVFYGAIALGVRTGVYDDLHLDGTAHQHLAWIAAYRREVEV